jgi:diacylglycerol kinase (ATP)
MDLDQSSPSRPAPPTQPAETAPMTPEVPRRRVLLLINRHSRRGREATGQAIEGLERHGCEVTFRSTQSSEDLNHTIHQYADRVDVVVIGGGDGTLNGALPTLLETGLTLGILPLGTANDLARTLALPLDLDGACRAIATGPVQPIDIGQVNDRYFFNVASLGLSVKITRYLSGAQKKRWGVLAYLWSAIQALTHSRPFQAQIEANGEIYRVQTVQIAVGNGRYYGGGLAIAWDATIDDRRLDLYSLEISHWWQMLPLLPALRSGRQSRAATVRTLEAEEIIVHTRRTRSVNTDGEITTETPAHFRVLPAALPVVRPAPAPPPPGEIR